MVLEGFNETQPNSHLDVVFDVDDIEASFSSNSKMKKAYKNIDAKSNSRFTMNT
jgi:hypothetical protein